MTNNQLRYDALIMAAYARIEGMKAANVEEMNRTATLAYGEEAFMIEAGKLEQLAYDVIQQG